MADTGLFERIGGLFGRGEQASAPEPEASGPAPEITKATAIPTRALGSVLTGYAGGETYYADRHLNLLGQQRWNVYEDMVRDIAIIAAGARLFLNLMANAVWTVNPPEDEDGTVPQGAQEIADTAYDILFDMTSSWSTVVRKVAMYRFAGFSVMEWTAKMRDDGAVGLLDVEHRPQRTITRWQRDPSGTVEGIVQRVAGRPEVVLPRSKVVYAVDDTLTDEPEGLGLFRHLAPTADRLRTFLDLEEVGFETDLRGIPIARAPLGELQKEVVDSGDEGSDHRNRAEARRQGMLRPLREFIEKHIRNKKTGVLLPSDTFISQGDKGNAPSAVPKWALELLNGDSQSFEQIAAAIKEMKQDLARVMGVEHLLLGSDGTGSLALARSKVGTFYLTITSTLYELVEIFDRDLIEPLSVLNGWPDELRPQMGVNEISDRDLEQVIDALSKLASAGAPVLPDDPAVGEIYDLLGLTRPPERADDLDASLVPGRRDPKDPNAPIEGSPEDDVAKRIIKSRRHRQQRRA